MAVSNPVPLVAPSVPPAEVPSKEESSSSESSSHVPPTATNSAASEAGLASPLDTPKKGHRSRSLELFYKKVMSLAALRTKALCLRMQIPSEIFRQVTISSIFHFF
jgi:hypothetical protein